jgi:hypothetical protein
MGERFTSARAAGGEEPCISAPATAALRGTIDSVAIQRMPDRPERQQFQDQAKVVRDFARAGIPEALDMVREFHPRLGGRVLSSAEADGFSLRDARLVVARRHGFASWPGLTRYLDVVSEFSRSPHRATTGHSETLADELLRLVCVTHGDDDPGRWQQGADLLARRPELGGTNACTAAATGDARAMQLLLERDANAAMREAGPHRWPPLLYLAYSTIRARLGGAAALEVTVLLLDAGADPNAGYLWDGLPSPYTALTGVLSSPPGPDLDLARVLLERSVDANDSQALYELGSAATGDDPEPLRLLIEFGLGAGRGGVWHRRLAPHHPTPTQLVQDELVRAAAANWPRRARLVLEHGVDVLGTGTNHPIYEGLTAWELALLKGSTAVSEVLAEGGAVPATADAALELLGACIRADRTMIDGLVASDPSLLGRAIGRRPQQLSVAADKDLFEAVALMIELGFDVNATVPYPHRQTALHGAAYNGNAAMVQLLLEHGAETAARDCSFDATPLEWARHNNQEDVIELLNGPTS